jgi:hypothetical protein
MKNNNYNKNAVPADNAVNPTYTKAGFFIGGVIVGLLLSLVFGNDEVAKNGKESLDPRATTTVELDNTNNATTTPTGPLVVPSQAPGKVVNLAYTLDANSWIAIRDNVNGKPGNILGARLFGKGSREGSIELIRATEVGKSYFAVVHNSNGDQKFDSKADAITNTMVRFDVGTSTSR